MPYVVIKRFKDKYTKGIYSPGDAFKSDERERVTDLIDRGLVKETDEEKPVKKTSKKK
mgnify:CR=1 FL=1